ncbi:C40 family peptidase [Spirillospora sp. NPDC047279]|uniref:C40 family peptidase n=1 Tax=Spirillospora sp. NPDC047279 TaxID=3155478 RepID=UPI0033F5CBC3
MSIPLKTACCATTVALAMVPGVAEAAELSQPDKIQASSDAQDPIATAQANSPAEAIDTQAVNQATSRAHTATAPDQTHDAAAPHQARAAATRDRSQARAAATPDQAQAAAAPDQGPAAAQAQPQAAAAPDQAQVAAAPHQGHSAATSSRSHTATASSRMELARAGGKVSVTYANGKVAAVRQAAPVRSAGKRQNGMRNTNAKRLAALQQAVRKQRARMEAQWQRRADRALRFALAQRGRPYVYGGTGGGGFDCSGLTQQSWRRAGVPVPRVAATQYRKIRNRVSRKNLRPGDLVFFNGLGHVGMYVGKSRFIHAPRTGRRVSVERLSGYYRTNYVGAVRPGWKRLPAIPTSLY